MAMSKKREVNPRSKYDSQARKVARKSLEIMKRNGLLERRSDLISEINNANPDSLFIHVYNVQIQGRWIPVSLVVDRDDGLDWIHIGGRYLQKGPSNNESIFVMVYRPWKLTSAVDIPNVHRDIVEVARHEMQHALQPPEERWRPGPKDVQLGYGSLLSFKRQYLNKEEVDAYAAGIYAQAKKSRRSFYTELGHHRSTMIDNWPEMDKKLIDRFILMVHERALVLYPELLKQKPIPKKRMKRERKDRARAAMAMGNPAKKKVARKKTPPYQLLINRCRKLWDHYCERPNKKRLKPVLEHLDKMKVSTSKKVADERRRCLRVANKEAKRLKMK